LPAGAEVSLRIDTFVELSLALTDWNICRGISFIMSVLSPGIVVIESSSRIEDTGFEFPPGCIKDFRSLYFAVLLSELT
jgi:hypothetical protein